MPRKTKFDAELAISVYLLRFLVLQRIFLSFCFFFFSSRRRHTRWPRDWSSDVCSSDLRRGGLHRGPRSEPPGEQLAARRAGIWRERRRSEERRVGKECRSRWSPYQ